MKTSLLLIPVITALLFGSLYGTSAFAQFQSGGVDKAGTWYAGEGLKQGDFFSYSMCHVDYKECRIFEMDIWIKGDKQVKSETKWLAEVVVYDGRKRVVGELELGKVAPETTGGSEELGSYRGAFKSSIVWLSAFATSNDDSGGKGPKKFTDISWGKIGNIGGEQVVPQAIETVVTPYGSWDTVQIGWKTGGIDSKIWVVDDFPFPVKAKTYIHVTEGKAPIGYEFTLLDYKENIQESPFAGLVSTIVDPAKPDCEVDFEKSVAIKKPTKNFDYQIHLFYGPEDLVQGCDAQWLIKFIDKYDDTEFLDEVQYDLLVVDDDLIPSRSVAQEEGRDFLYSPFGQAILDFRIKEDPGTAKYVIWIYGSAPIGIVPSTRSDYLEVEVPIYDYDGAPSVQRLPTVVPPTVVPPTVVPPTVVPPTVVPPVPIPSHDGALLVQEGIPSWIQTSSGFWVDGDSSDTEFVNAIQFLIEKGIMEIPKTTQGLASTNEIPSWIKTTVGFWVDGDSSDTEFISAIQFLIEKGIITIS